jgi:hypothetical protein
MAVLFSLSGFSGEVERRRGNGKTEAGPPATRKDDSQKAAATTTKEEEATTEADSSAALRNDKKGIYGMTRKAFAEMTKKGICTANVRQRRRASCS